MNANSIKTFTIFLATFLFTSAMLRGDDELERQASWTILTTEQARLQVTDFLTDKDLDELTTARIEALWPSGDEAPRRCWTYWRM